MKMYMLIFILLIFSVSCFAYDIEIPKGSSGNLSLDPADYKDSVKIENFNVESTLLPGEPKTELYLKYDNENLYALFVCYENNKLYPESYLRKDDLMRDDAVQIGLGTSANDSVRESLSMGGYAGAYSSVDNCDFYYQFTVNSENQKERQYLEMTMERPLFDSKVKKDNNKWSVSMKIPFSSFGVENPAGKEIFFNAWRSRPPYLLGYKNYHYGSYTPIPFAKAKLGTKPQVIETFTKPETMIQNKIEEFLLNLYPLENMVAGQVLAKNITEKMYMVLKSDKFPEKRAEITSDKYFNLTCDLGENVSLPVNFVCSIENESGDVLKEKTLTVSDIPQKPEYYNTKVGDKTQIPAPWTRPEIKDNVIKFVNKDITIGKNGFFASVKGKEELLSREMGFSLSVNGVPQTLKLVNQNIKPFERGVLVTSNFKTSKGNTFDIKLKIDFDGFTMVRMKSDDIDPKTIDGLSLSIPLKRENALFINRYFAQTIQKTDGFGWSGDAPLGVWVGSHSVGIGYEFEPEMPVILSENKRKQVELIEKNTESILKLNFVDGKGQVKDKGHIFRFYLTPTPTKDSPSDKIGLYNGIDKWHEEWSDWQGYFDFAKIPQMKERAEKDKAQGKDLMIYFSQSLAEDSPSSLDYFSDLTAYPLRSWYKRAYNPGKDVPCYVSCPRGLFGDLLLYGLDKAVKEGDVKGAYLDGPANPWECYNPSHNHCEGIVENSWDDSMQYPYEATREFLIRMRNILAQGGSPKIIVHTGGVIYPSQESLADGHFEGEQIARYKIGYNIPLYKFANGYSGSCWGMNFEVLPALNVNNGTKLRTLCYLHGNFMSHDLETGELSKRIYKDFIDKETVFAPYWEDNNKLINYKGKSLLTAYYKNDKALLIFGNVTMEKDTVTCDLSKIFGENVTVRDMDTREFLNEAPNNISFELEPNHYRIFFVEPFKAQAEIKEPYRFSDNNIVDTPLGKGIKGIKQRAEGRIYINKKIGRGIYIKGKIYHSDILSIGCGETRLFFQNGKFHLLQNPSKKEKGEYYPNVTIPIEGSVDIELAVVNDRMDLILDGKTVTKSYLINISDEDEVVFATWNDGSIAFVPETIESRDKGIFEIKRIISSDFEIKDSSDQWTLNEDGLGVSGNIYDDKITVKSTRGAGNAEAIVMLQKSLGNFYGEFEIEKDGNLVIQIGKTRMLFMDNTVRFNNLNPWNLGITVSDDFSSVNKLNIKMSLNNNKLDMFVNDKLLCSNVLIDMYETENKLSFRTWAGYSINVKPLYITSKDIDLVPDIHPVL